MKTTDSAQIEQIVLAGGCFWGTQHLLQQLHGVRRTRVGYVNSNMNNPSYNDVKTGNTAAAEGVEVEYNATVVDLSKLLDFFLRSIDPTSKDKQGGDIGSQYRTGIYYTTDSQKRTALEAIDRLQKKYNKPIVTEVLPLKNFYEAEDEHQDYLDKNPGGYCHVSRELMSEARHSDILKASAPTVATHADANYANENTHGSAHGQPFENDAVYPDTKYRNKPGE
ncbi:MAG: peptide-methionine (S)-S-oxide reductase MsrA [Prevotella sp.]|nr:peptide-methionine (S)-S-oxide reductase MsrA [Prevotella sp.]MCM1074980.1 peptide-methionine (S)-S-oxide reductase MsrA [Ruminococcus sp.]